MEHARRRPRPRAFRAVFPRTGLLTDAILVLAGTGIVAAAAQVSFKLPHTPVPITGFVVAAAVTGFLAEHGWDRKLSSSLGAMLTGNVVISSSRGRGREAGYRERAHGRRLGSRGVRDSVRVVPGRRAETSARSPRIPVVEERLLAWFSQTGADLPWRRTTDPYAILVSEIMLQQTQVERVVPRFLAWLERWPTVGALAAASAGEVIREWQGLGYNRRALSLHRAAQRIAADGWPADLTELPGVGRYTADAVRRFAHGEPVLPRDTNVERVERRTGARFTHHSAQALMDLGREICLARVPRCGACPLAQACPSRGRRYEPLRKQSRFEGSFRQRRARTLRRVAEGPLPVGELDAEAVASLAADGLVVVEQGQAALPA